MAELAVGIVEGRDARGFGESFSNRSQSCFTKFMSQRFIDGRKKCIISSQVPKYVVDNRRTSGDICSHATRFVACVGCVRFSEGPSKVGDHMKVNMMFVLLLTAVGEGGEPARFLAQVAPDRPALARDDKSKDSAAGTQPDLEELKQAAASYRVVADDKVPNTMVLVVDPVLHWTNPLRQTHDGAVFIWVAGGRPKVVASLYRYKADGKTFEDHEFQSLATTGLTATRNGQQVWAPRTAGITLTPIPGAPSRRPRPPSGFARCVLWRTSSTRSLTYPEISRSYGSCPGRSTDIWSTDPTSSTGPSSRSSWRPTPRSCL